MQAFDAPNALAATCRTHISGTDQTEKSAYQSRANGQCNDEIKIRMRLM